MSDKKEKCCICGAEIRYGNDPWPVRAEGRCCDKCNWTVVIPERKRRYEEAHPNINDKKA